MNHQSIKGFGSTSISAEDPLRPYQQHEEVGVPKSESATAKSSSSNLSQHLAIAASGNFDINGNHSRQVKSIGVNHNIIQTQTSATHNMHDSSPAESSSTETPLLTESTMSLQEMFDQEDFVPSPYVQAEQRHHAGGPTGPTNEDDEHGDDEWFSGDGGILNTHVKDGSSFTPPSSLYAGTTTKYGSVQPAVIPESSNPSSVSSSGMNTPVSSILSLGEGPPSSVGSNTTNGTPRSRPLLYSAIGSLENFNAASYRDLSKRVGPRKDFSKLGSVQVTTLIPPATTTGTASSTSRALLPVDGHLLSSQETKPMSSARSTASTRATPTASNRKPNAENSKAEGQPQGKTAAQDSKPSNLKKPGASTTRESSSRRTGRGGRKVSIKKEDTKKKPVEMFRPSSDAYTPRIEKKRIKYRKAEMRTPVQKMASPMGTLSRPNFRDALRRVAMIMHQHIVKIERRFEGPDTEKHDQGLFTKSMRETFSEDNYCTPTYKCTMVRIPMARPGMVYGLRKIKIKQAIPSEEEIYEFAHQLFKAVQLSSECSIVCLIYVERLMETAKVPLLANTWRPVFMCGLLLASKVWQDLSSWNIEFASVYPQYSLDAINRLELNFLRNVKWDLYISTSLYAKYYFALRSLVEKVDFRQRYNRMVGGVDSVAQSEALKISKRTEQFKEETILQLSRSM